MRAADEVLRRYSADMRKVVRATLPLGPAPSRPALDPAGGRLVIGRSYPAGLTFLDATTLAAEPITPVSIGRNMGSGYSSPKSIAV